MRTQRPWTKARVLRAYAEWRALTEHVERVVDEYEHATANDVGGSGFIRVELPGWVGSGWPGTDVEFRTFDDDYAESEYRSRLPLVYLWTTGWIAELKRKHDTWAKAAEGRAVEAREREQYEKLKAKFEAAS